MRRTRYAISWLYGEFRLARFQRGEIVDQWESPTPVESQADLVRALDAAATHVDMNVKGDVTIVHEHDLHTHDYLEVPSMKRRDLEKYLQRRVEQDKSFSEKADWCYHQVAHQDGKEGVLLHLLPKRIVQATVSACTTVGLAPKYYVPLTEIVSDYLPTTDVAPESLIVMVACFRSRTEIIVALGDGEALFVRELNYGLDSETTERLISDVNRTLRYARQQLGRSLDTAWFMGELDPTVATQLNTGIDIPVYFDEQAADPYFWARWATRLSGKLSANFISALTQRNITVESVRRVAAWSTAAVIAVSVLMTLFTGGLVAHRADQKNAIQIRSDEVRDLIQQVESKLAAGRLKQDHLGRLQATSKNLPPLMLANLSSLTPDEVTLTSVAIERAAQGWQVQLKGLVAGDMRESARVLALFEDSLSQPPWRLSLSQSFTETWMQQFEQGKLKQSGKLGFQIAGNFR
jgi:hypothetical protein